LDRVSRLAVLSLLFARVIYAINWFNVASIFPHIALDFKQDISILGLILCDRGIEASTCGIDTPVTINMDSIPSLSGTGALGYKYDKNDTKH